MYERAHMSLHVCVDVYVYIYMCVCGCVKYTLHFLLKILLNAQERQDMQVMRLWLY